MPQAKSSLFKRYTYDGDSQTLTIHYPSGHKYSHVGVPKEEAAAMESAQSAGRYFLDNVRDKHPGRRV